MKFTHRTFPVLEMLKGSLDIWPLQLRGSSHLIALFPTINSRWQAFSSEFSKNIFFMADTFIKAMEKDVFTWSADILKDFQVQKRTTFFSGSATFMSKNRTFCIYTDAEKGRYCVFEFFPYQGNLCLRSVLLLENSATEPSSELFFLADPFIADVHHRTEVYNVFAQILATLFFVQNVEPQTKYVVPAKGKIQTINKEKIVNGTSFDIDVLDARWYTTIVRSEPFRVEGFTRKQRHGPGFSLVKEKVIESFWKKGYTIRAKMLKED
ncbi:hypothetical protein [Chitinophaga sp. YIM B06452]|uniref:hypothetical protein n=1 Tax=Chitinophaga sp. YIM B06452 TaxID=3082158 RepID=UPI0031FED9F6